MKCDEINELHQIIVYDLNVSGLGHAIYDRGNIVLYRNYKSWVLMHVVLGDFEVVVHGYKKEARVNLAEYTAEKMVAATQFVLSSEYERTTTSHLRRQ